jgi:hypothetical protein
LHWNSLHYRKGHRDYIINFLVKNIPIRFRTTQGLLNGGIYFRDSKIRPLVCAWQRILQKFHKFGGPLEFY